MSSLSLTLYKKDILHADYNPENKIVCMDIDVQNEAWFKIRYGTRYIYTIFSTVDLVNDSVEHEILHMPLVIIDTLPISMIPSYYNYVALKTFSDGKVEFTCSYVESPSATYIWYDNIVDILSLTETDILRPWITGCLFNGILAVYKIRRHKEEMIYVDNESRVYELIYGMKIAPQFFAHLTEGGKYTGCVMERLYGRQPVQSDVGACYEALYKLHSAGILHNDIRRSNMLVTDSGVMLLDFENSIVNATDFSKDIRDMSLLFDSN